MTTLHFHGANLIPSARQYAKQRRVRTKRWFTVGIVYAGLVFLGAVFARVSWVFDNRSVSGQLASLLNEIEQSDEAAKVLRMELQHARALAETRNVVADQPDWSLLLAVLSTATGDEIVLRNVQLKQGELSEPAPALAVSAGAGIPAATPSNASTNKAAFTFALQGLGRSQSAVSLFLLRLEQLELFDQVRLVETRREPFLIDEAVAFRISCTLK